MLERRETHGEDTGDLQGSLTFQLNTDQWLCVRKLPSQGKEPQERMKEMNPRNLHRTESEKSRA